MVPANTQLLHPNFEGSPGNEKIDLPEERRHGQDQIRSGGNLGFPSQSDLELAYIWGRGGGEALQQDDLGSKSWALLLTSFATQVIYLTSLCLGFPSYLFQAEVNIGLLRGVLIKYTCALPGW